MKGTLFRLLTLLMVVNLAIAACGPPPEATRTPEPTKVAPEPTKEEATPEESFEETPEASTLEGTISLWHAWEEHEIESLNKVLAAFQDMHPGVEFEVLYVPFDDLRDRYETAAATGGGPSILIGGADWGPALFDAELISDVTGRTPDSLLQTISPAALGAVKYRNSLIGLPHTVRGVVM